MSPQIGGFTGVRRGEAVRGLNSEPSSACELPRFAARKRSWCVRIDTFEREHRGLLLSGEMGAETG